MLAFPSMLGSAAEKAGINVPNFENLEDDWHFDPEEFPHFHVFCIAQLGRPMVSMGEHWENAKVIAAIPDDEIRSVSLEYLLDRGLSWAS